MNLLVMAVGTRGDVQPTLAFALGLQQAGYNVKVLAGANFRAWIESFGLPVVSTLNIEALMQTDKALKWVEGNNPLEQLRYMKAIMDDHETLIHQTLREAVQDSEVMISGFVSAALAQTLSEIYHIPLLNAFFQPYRPTYDGRSTMNAVLPNRHSVLNYGLGLLSERLVWTVSRDVTNSFRQQMGLMPHTATRYIRASRAIPLLYAMSRHVVPPQDDALHYTGGYWFLDEPYTPPADLLAFLESGEPPVYVGFGSMPSSDPQKTVSMVADVLHQQGLRGILAKGWSGASESLVRDNVFLLESASHTWLFPRVRAVVHHGGAGTTAAGLRAGKPTLIVPHMGDQPYWGQRVYDLGVGVKPLPRAKLNAENFAQKLQELVNRRTIADNASQLGEKIRAEQGVANAVDWVKQQIARL